MLQSLQGSKVLIPEAEIVLVTGARDWDDEDLIHRAFLRFHHLGLVVQGGCRGADKLAQVVADRMEIPCLTIPARWGKFGRAAGAIRNTEMHRWVLAIRDVYARIIGRDQPGMILVLAFHDNISESKGTASMIAIARKANLPVQLVSHSQYRKR